jgi:hypothetical protein
VPGQVLQQRGLAGARLAVYHQRPALTSADSLDQPVKHAALGATAGQLSGTPPYR